MRWSQPPLALTVPPSRATIYIGGGSALFVRCQLMQIRIEPDFPLKDTARIVGDILGIQFKFDDSGFFEEFPAYSSAPGRTRLALLGPPDDSFMGDQPWRDYYLQLSRFEGTVSQHDSFIIETQKRIATDGRLRSDLSGSKHDP